MLHYFSSIIIFNGILFISFGVILLFNKNKFGIEANKVLSLLFVLIGICYIIFAFGQLELFTRLYLLDHVLLFLGLPIFYFYIRTYFRNRYKFDKLQLLHLTPFIIQFFIWLYLLISPEAQSAEFPFDANNFNFTIFKNQHKINILVLSLFYFYLIRKDIITYQELVKQEYSYSDENTLIWFYIFLGLIISTPLLISFVNFSSNQVHSIYPAAIMTINTFAIVLLILCRPEIYKSIGAISPIQLSRRSNKNCSLSHEKKEKIFNALLELMENKKLYLNPKINLKDLSKTLETNPNYLSQSINTISGKSFFDFINSCRIDHAKELLVNNAYSNYTIEAISKESGFNSKSTFYAAFNKLCNMYPSEFIKRFRQLPDPS